MIDRTQGLTIQGVIRDFEVGGKIRHATVLGHAPPPPEIRYPEANSSGVSFGVAILYLKWGSDSEGVKIGFVGCIFLCARVSKTCVLLDVDLCFSEVLDMDLGTINLSCKRSRTEVDVSDSAIFVHA